eukprot:7549480-Heterocapsa_arctica.AAC.1
MSSRKSALKPVSTSGGRRVAARLAEPRTPKAAAILKGSADTGGGRHCGPAGSEPETISGRQTAHPTGVRYSLVSTPASRSMRRT